MGVLGGMGVYATINFITQFINKFKVNKEWEYPKYIIHCNPQLPSRSRHIFYNEESPMEILKEDIIHLNYTNIDFIVIPCNTVHFYIEELQKFSKVKILNMIEIVSNYIIKNLQEQPLHIIGTEAMFKTKLYNNYGLKNLVYSEDISSIRTVIDSVKNNIVDENTINLFKNILLKDKLNILCCTELSKLVTDNKESFKNYRILDPIKVFIDYIVEVEYYKLK